MAATPELSIFLLLVVLAVSTNGSSAAGSSWCVCKPELPAAALQRMLDYACGHGADCAPLLPGGQCHSGTDTVATRCSHAANSYYQNAKAKASGGDATCDFSGTATLTSTDPSSGSCRYPAPPTSAPPSASRVLLFLFATISILTSLSWCATRMDDEEERRKASMMSPSEISHQLEHMHHHVHGPYDSFCAY